MVKSHAQRLLDQSVESARSESFGQAFFSGRPHHRAGDCVPACADRGIDDFCRAVCSPGTGTRFRCRAEMAGLHQYARGCPLHGNRRSRSAFSILRSFLRPSDPAQSTLNLFEIRKSNGQLLARSSAPLPAEPEGTGTFNDFVLSGIPYRAIVLRQVPVLDQEDNIITPMRVNVTYAAPLVGMHHQAFGTRNVRRVCRAAFALYRQRGGRLGRAARAGAAERISHSSRIDIGDPLGIPAAGRGFHGERAGSADGSHRNRARPAP